MKKNLLLILLSILVIMGCKKENELNPLLGNWEIKRIYTKNMDPTNGLREENIDVNAFLQKKGFYPSLYKEIKFYNNDSVAFIASEPVFIATNEDGLLYYDPDRPSNINKVTDRLVGTYKIKDDSISFQLYSSNRQMKFTDRYFLENNSLQLTIIDVDRELEGRPVISKEIWYLERNK